MTSFQPPVPVPGASPNAGLALPAPLSYVNNLPPGLAGPGRFELSDSAYNMRSTNTRRLRAGLARSRTGGKGRLYRTGASISMGLSIAPDTFGPNQNGPSKYLRDGLALEGYPSAASTGWAMASLDGSGLGRKDSRWAYSGFTPVAGSFVAVSTATGSTATFTTDVAGAAVDLLVVGSSGPMTYKIGAAAAVAVPLSGTYAFQKVTVATAVTAGTAVVVTTGSAAASFVAGARVAAASALEVSALAYSGSSTALWRPDADPVGGLGPLFLGATTGEVPDCVFVGLDPVINSVWGVGNGNAADNALTAGLADVGAQVAAWLALGSDVVLVFPHQINPGVPGVGGAMLTNARWATFRQGAYALADQYDVPLVDMTDRVGDYPTVNAAGYLADPAHGKASLYSADGALVDQPGDDRRLGRYVRRDHRSSAGRRRRRPADPRPDRPDPGVDRVDRDCADRRGPVPRVLARLPPATRPAVAR